jgi:thiol-disulfide isomerase/thioredoxin
MKAPLAALLTLATALALAAQSTVAAGPAASAPKARKHHEENSLLYQRWGLDPAHLLYSKTPDARSDFQSALGRAKASGKLLMVTFGANWCPDCRALHRSLSQPATRRYVSARFELVNVDVGDFDRNIPLASELGVDLDAGIPVAIFLAPDGSTVGTTNNGELEPARSYTSRQILAFMHEVAENRRVPELKKIKRSKG